jgi:hypothetical protein
MSSKKSEKLVPLIINAKTEQDAVEVLKQTLKILNLTSDYVELNNLKYELNDFEAKFKKVADNYKELGTPKRYIDVHEIRVELNFLYRDITDALAFSINQNKIYFEEQKTVVRAESMLELRDDEALQDKVKAKSTSALRDIYGAAEGTKEFVNLASISYGLYKNLETLLNGVKMLTDSIASEEKYLLMIETRDVK